MQIKKNERSFDSDGEQNIFTTVKTNAPKEIKISEIVHESKPDTDIEDAATKINNNPREMSDKNVYFPFKMELTIMGPLILRGSKIPQILTRSVFELVTKDTSRKRS